jgi:hypothetical protein
MLKKCFIIETQFGSKHHYFASPNELALVDLDKNSYCLPGMMKGFNSDIQVRGKSYHVQTEDWGKENPFLVSRVFCNGAVLKTIKTPYEEALRGGPSRDVDGIKLALRQQHNRVVDDVFSGTLTA